MSEKKKQLAFTRTEVERFYKESAAVRLRLDSLLDDHHNKAYRLTEASLKSIYEMILDSIAFEDSLDDLFDLESTRTFFKISEQDVLLLSKLTLLMGHSKSLLLLSGVCIEAH